MDWGLAVLRHTGALLDFSMPPCGITSPSVTWTAPAPDWPRDSPPSMGQGSVRPRETVQTRAVNQQARTMTPQEAKTLLSVNAHRNSRLLNQERNRVKSDGERAVDSWMKISSQTEVTLPYMH